MPYASVLSQKLVKAGLPALSGNIYGIGRNYRKHAEELGNAVPDKPLVFLKAPASLRALHEGPLAFAQETFHHEAELVLLVGKPVELGDTANWEHVVAMTLGLDLTRRDEQDTLKKAGHPWTTAKSFAGSALLGDFLPSRMHPQQDAIGFTLSVNGQERQQGNTRNMIFSVPTILTYLASFNGLTPGDLIFTGTPEGVGPLHKGDQLSLAFTEINVSFQGCL